MRTVNLFDKDIPIRDFGCNYDGLKAQRYEKDRVNLFIQVTDSCNASCAFCNWHKEQHKDFNLNKLSMILKELKSHDNLEVGKLNFTGGEPTLDIIKFNEVVGCVRDYFTKEDDTEITLNTNGIHLLDLVYYDKILNSIGLSRHYYEDGINSQIFGSDKVATAETIKEFQSRVRDKRLVQLRCNLITGYVDSAYEMEKYMQKAISIGCYDCGFVTLMHCNDYCLSHQVEFNSLISGLQNVLQVNHCTREENGKEVCKCCNYVYTHDGQFCKFYSRLFSHCSLYEGQLVYDGEYLRYGFDGEIIV